jgi:hypothetical protein
MIRIDHLYQRSSSENNTSQNGFWRPQTDFEKAANSVDSEIYTEYTSMAEKTQEVRDNLSVFLKHANVKTTNKGAFALGQYPKQYVRFSSAKIVVAGEKCYPDFNVNQGLCEDGTDPFEMAKKIEAFWNNVEIYPVTLVGDDRWASAVSHRTKRPTLKTAIMKQTDFGFEIFPRTVSVVVVDYYFKPPYVKLNYTKSLGNPQTGGGDQIIFSEDNQGAFLWPETMINEFLRRLREKYAMFTRDQVGNNINNSQKVA